MSRSRKASISRQLGDVLLEQDIGPLVRKASQLAQMTDAIGAVLPAELASEVRVANLRQGIVILQASGAAAASKLRMLVPRMKDRLQSIACSVEDIQIQIRPEAHSPPLAKPHGRLPSPEAGQRLEALAASLEDAPLRRAIASLAKKARQRDR